jgi:hypothetical protein
VALYDWHEAVGADYVALGMTAYAGTVGGLGAKPWVVPRAPAGSIDALAPRMAAFRFIGRAELGDLPRVGRFFGLSPSTARWGRVLDGALLFREVTPVTPERSTHLDDADRITP